MAGKIGDYGDLARSISTWLREYAQSHNISGFVVGVSGGVDSGVVSTLCARTGLPTVVVEMPIHQKEDQVTRAQLQISWLLDNFVNIVSQRVDLTSTFDQFLGTVSAQYSDSLAEANTRSRLRMVTLYYLAQLGGLMVVGTGNKVEDFGIGFYTKYGDGGVDISPIGDLLKSEVRELARYLGLPSEVAEAVPTDGLWDNGVTDEDQIGATYDELEWAMSYEAGDEPTNTTRRQSEVLEIYRKFNRRNKHKMEPIPVFSTDQFRSAETMVTT